ncbi:nucleolar protein dao-5-like isoform X2 [Panicum virgatum]|uniref:nucleolar protein dao-5-like isoform X2 n=1 Tax=Panicum virgatum TaxID=38727 RepID=UPI0019D51366|nr:nucleolar protein dao-5-like isoform X2 [Panicum virgatum]
MEAAAAAMDFHALSRRELQALCKRNGVRANMTNAAMAEALQGLASVDGIDEIDTTLCLPMPGRSAMKSAAKKAELADEEQQHGSPLPRGRRVSVKSPEAIRMEVEEGEDEMKRDLVKEIVRTHGVALRSTSRRARLTPAPLPTPVPASSARATTRRAPARKAEEVAPTPGTLRRSQRTAARKAAAPVEEEQPAEDVSAAKRTTRSTKSKMTLALDQEEEVVAAASKEEEKVQQEEPKAVASDVRCDDPDEDEVTKDNKEEEADSSDTAIGSAVPSDKSCDDTKMEEVMVVMEEEDTKTQEGIVEEKEPTSVEKPAPLATMEDSPILGVLSKSEASEPVIQKAQDATLGDDEGCAEWSPVTEIADEIDAVIADKEVPVDEEAIKEESCTITGETDNFHEILPTAAEEDETSEDNGLTEVKEGAADEMPQAGVEAGEEDDLIELKGGAADEVPKAELEEDDLTELTDDETSEEEEEDDLHELKERAAAKMPQAELADDKTSEENEEWASDDAEASEEIYSTDDSDEETDTADVVQRLQGTVIAEEAAVEDASTEDDDFSGDLPPEFDDVAVFNDSDTESDIAAPVLEENQDLVASATKTALKPLDDSDITEEHAQEADATEKAVKEVDKIMKSLDAFTIKEGEAKEEMQKLPQVDDYESMSLRKLKATYKEHLMASKAGKRFPLEEVDENACGDC